MLKIAKDVLKVQQCNIVLQALAECHCPNRPKLVVVQAGVVTLR